MLHYQGEIVPKDLAQAYTWSILAAKRGHLLAGTTMRKLRPQFTDEQVAEAARLAKEWKPVN